MQGCCKVGEKVGAALVAARIARRAMTAIALTTDSGRDKPAPRVSTSRANRPYILLDFAMALDTAAEGFIPGL